MDFDLDTADAFGVSDLELSELLLRVYVEGGFVEAEMAVALFEPAAVRRRGKIVVAREKQGSTLAGMVIIVDSHSPAHRFAQGTETEMHLLGVKPEFRKQGLGRALVTAAIDDATRSGSSKMLLWTQATMHVAQRLYESSGFVRVPSRDFSRASRDFKMYEKELSFDMPSGRGDID